jgi:phosphatidate cytidylyltransferase
MALHWPTFFTRLGSAVVFAIIMMAGLLWNEWGFAALMALIQALCIRDYFGLMDKIYPPESSKSVYWLTQAGAFIVLLVLQLSVCDGIGLMTRATNGSGFIGKYLLIANYRDARPATWTGGTRALLWISTLFIPVLIFLVTGLSSKRNLKDALVALSALLYIGLPCYALVAVYQLAWFIPLVLILCIWMNDTMAYLVGSFIGRTPFSKISPKKTWEGTAGGALLTIVGAAIAAYVIEGQSMILYMALALCAALAGTAGDLLESKLKRTAGVKDSGTMMPGHGGALDRFDSLLVAAPFAVALSFLIFLICAPF